MGMNTKYLRNEFNDYMIQVANARIFHQVPHFWLKSYDHITYQTSSPHALDVVIKGLKPESEQITCIEHEGPFEVAIKLAAPLVVAKNVSVSWINVKEIDREAPGKQWEGINALNVLVGSLQTMKSRLTTSTNLDPAESDNRLELILNGRGQRLNFIETPISTITEQLLEDKYAIPVFPRVGEPGRVWSQD